MSYSISLANNLTISLSPYLEEDYIFKEMTLSEWIGSNLPQGTITFECSPENVDLTNDKLQLKVEQGDGILFEAECFVTCSKYASGTLIIEFMGAPKDFITAPLSRNFESLNEALNSLYPGDIVKNLESDITGNLDISQVQESSFRFCNKIARAYKKDSIFGYLFSGLYFFDPLDTSNQLAAIIGGKYALIQPYENRNIKYRDFNETIQELDNLNSVIYDKQIAFIDAQYSDLMKNFLYNEKYYTLEKTYIPLRSTYISDIFPGASVRVTGPDIEDDDYICKHRRLAFTRQTVTSDIHLIQY